MANLDDMIDQIAFGKTAPKAGPVLGMYLSPEVIYLAETHFEKGQIAVDHLVRIPVPAPEKAAASPAATGTLNTDFLMNNEKLTALIKQSMGSIKWGTKDVFVTLSHHLGLLRYFAMPAIDRRFWNSAVPVEAKKYIPIPFDALSHDFQVVPLPPDASNKPRQGALISVTQKKNLANVSDLLKGLDLKLIGMEVAPCSVLRLWESMDKDRAGKTHCQVHFDGGSIRILLADKGLPVFFRELFLGKEAQMSDQRKIDLAGCASFAQKQLGAGQLGQVFVSGGIPELAQWQDAFGKELGTTAAVHDTPARLGIKGGDWGGYAAIGASLRLLSQGPITLDLGQVGKISDDERKTARDLIFGSAALALFFAVVGLYRSFSYSYRARELQKYQVEPEIEAVFAGKGALDIEGMLRLMTVQGQGARIAQNDPIKATALLQDLVNAMPDNTWLTDIHYRNPVVKNLNDTVTLAVSGRAKGPSVSAEQDMAFSFRDKLLKSPILGKVFPEVQVSVSGKPVDIDSSKSLDPETLQERLEERTTFQATMAKKSP
jgi:hypothetical protein